MTSVKPPPPGAVAGSLERGTLLHSYLRAGTTEVVAFRVWPDGRGYRVEVRIGKDVFRMGRFPSTRIAFAWARGFQHCDQWTHREKL